MSYNVYDKQHLVQLNWESNNQVNPCLYTLLQVAYNIQCRLEKFQGFVAVMAHVCINKFTENFYWRTLPLQINWQQMNYNSGSIWKRSHICLFSKPKVQFKLEYKLRVKFKHNNVFVMNKFINIMLDLYIKYFMFICIHILKYAYINFILSRVSS